MHNHDNFPRHDNSPWLLRSLPPALLLLSALLLAACESLHKADSYARQELGQSIGVRKGVVISVREVTVEGTDSKLGAVTGAVIGGAIGTRVGDSDTSKVIGGTAAGVAGAVIGNKAEEILTRSAGQEVVLRLQESGETLVVVQALDKEKNELSPGDPVLLLQSDRLRVVRDQGQAPAQTSRE